MKIYFWDHAETISLNPYACLNQVQIQNEAIIDSMEHDFKSEQILN